MHNKPLQGIPRHIAANIALGLACSRASDCNAEVLFRNSHLQAAWRGSCPAVPPSSCLRRLQLALCASLLRLSGHLGAQNRKPRLQALQLTTAKPGDSAGCWARRDMSRPSKSTSKRMFCFIGP